MRVVPTQADHELLEAILDNAAHAFISTTPDGTITSFNKAAEDMLGYAAEEVVDKHNPGLFHLGEEVVRRSAEFSRRLGTTIEPGFQTFVCHCDAGLENQFEWTYVRKDGTHLTALLSITTLTNRAGQKTGYLGIAQDLSSIKAIEKSAIKLKRSNDELAQFAYRTSHDLKAPLVTIKGLAQCIDEDLESNDIDEIKRNTKKIIKHADRLKKLVGDILDLAKAEAYEQPAEAIDLRELSEELRDSMKSLCKQKSVQLTFEWAGAPEVLAQKLRLRQILENLILNGIKYSDPDKEEKIVKVAVMITDEICVTVEDNGLGISSENQKKLYDVFTRFHPGAAEGSGLGMSIVRNHVDQLGGKIHLFSEGTRTCFTVTLPIRKGAAT